MKKFLIFILITSVLLVLSSCSSSKDITPQITQMKSICELATMKCYYHNVAKYYEEDVEGFIWKKDRRFWIEYSGVVTLGIDASQLDIVVSDNAVTITIPPAKVLSCKVDEKTLNKNSFIIDSKSAAIEPQHQTEAFKNAQKTMLDSASNDTALLANAQQRAKDLLEDYVKNIGNVVGKEYIVEFVDLDLTAETSTTDTSTT